MSALTRPRRSVSSTSSKSASERRCSRIRAVHQLLARDPLYSLCSDELNGRAGRQRGGYVEPTEAAWELLEEAVEAFGREVGRLIALGMIGPAVDTTLGVIAGLHRCDGCEDRELLLSWAPDFPLAHASGIVDQLASEGIELPPELLAAAAPAWATALSRARRAHA